MVASVKKSAMNLIHSTKLMGKKSTEKMIARIKFIGRRERKKPNKLFNYS